MGLEPMISRTTIWRANQLHHTHHTEPGGIRTLDLRLRRPLLYPAELQTRINFIPVYRLLTDHSVRKRVMGIEPTYPAWKAGVLRPPGPKPGALAKLSHTPLFAFVSFSP